MIGLPEQVSIYLYTQPVDFSKGFDGLTGIVTTSLGHNVTDKSHVTIDSVELAMWIATA